MYKALVDTLSWLVVGLFGLLTALVLILLSIAPIVILLVVCLWVLRWFGVL